MPRPLLSLYVIREARTVSLADMERRWPRSSAAMDRDVGADALGGGATPTVEGDDLYLNVRGGGWWRWRPERGRWFMVGKPAAGRRTAHRTGPEHTLPPAAQAALEQMAGEDGDNPFHSEPFRGADGSWFVAYDNGMFYETLRWTGHEWVETYEDFQQPDGRPPSYIRQYDRATKRLSNRTLKKLNW